MSSCLFTLSSTSRRILINEVIVITFFIAHKKSRIWKPIFVFYNYIIGKNMTALYIWDMRIIRHAKKSSKCCHTQRILPLHECKPLSIKFFEQKNSEIISHDNFYFFQTNFLPIIWLILKSFSTLIQSITFISELKQYLQNCYLFSTFFLLIDKR